VKVLGSVKMEIEPLVMASEPKLAETAKAVLQRISE